MRTQEEWQARERELLETANKYLERARVAERRAETMVKAANAFNKIVDAYYTESDSNG